MTEVKDRHRCGECDNFDLKRGYCRLHINFDIPPESWQLAELDDEACSDFEPKGGWQE